MRVQGSYTVEAALVVPIVLGCILLILSQTIDLYIEVTETTDVEDLLKAALKKMAFL